MGPPLGLVACVTVTVALIPLPVTVMVPVRTPPLFAVTVAVKLPLLEPLAGETVNHEVLFDETVQATLAVTVIVSVEAVSGGLQVVGETFREPEPG